MNLVIGGEGSAVSGTIAIDGGAMAKLLNDDVSSCGVVGGGMKQHLHSHTKP